MTHEQAPIRPPQRRNSLIPAGIVLAIAATGVGGYLFGRSMESNQARASSADVRPSASPALATPKPSEAAGTPRPDGKTKPSPSVGPGTPKDHELKPGQSITTKGVVLVQGDVEVNGAVLYDNDPRTGLIVQIEGGTNRIVAPWGADVQVFGENVDRKAFESTLGRNIELMKQKGCDPKPQSGCNSVTVVKIVDP